MELMLARRQERFVDTNARVVSKEPSDLDLDRDLDHIIHGKTNVLHRASERGKTPTRERSKYISDNQVLIDGDAVSPRTASFDEI
ncbi:hypothetical protein QR680_002001 [Steinernema hermaphroditum]|uniref:Uncharacterized protein n=1 Tax=Steinernema hermaphroditum TaxID=289476 RepID=A0AA39H1P7_9BILA|nr:hypothetical protein QR680_002001 [Steinernema hermaphroditum]